MKGGNLKKIIIYKETGDETYDCSKINYLYMSDGRSSHGAPFTVAAVSGDTILYSEFEVFDTTLFSDGKIIEPFIKIPVEWETIQFNGAAQFGIKPEKSESAVVASLLLNTGNINLKKTRQRNPLKQKDIYEIVFKDGTVIQIQGIELKTILKSIFPQLNETQYRNKYYLYIDKKAFHHSEIDCIKWEDASYKDGTPYKAIHITLKNGKKVHSYSKRVNGFRIEKWMQNFGIIPSMFYAEGTGQLKNRHRFSISRKPGPRRTK